MKISQLSNLYNKSIPFANNYDIVVIPLYRYTRIFSNILRYITFEIVKFLDTPKIPCQK